MKNLKKVLISSIILTIFFLSGCANSLQSDNQFQNQFGTLKVSSSDSKSRALDIEEIKFASCVISGTGINVSEAPSKSGLAVEGGVGTLSIENIPIGKNRIVTVQAYASSTEKMDGVTLRAVTDIVSGENSVVVNWSTTALGNVFYNLFNSGYDISSVTQDQISQIQSAIPIDIHPSLVNAAKIAEDFKTSSLSAANGYKTEPATLNVTVNETDSFKIQVCDPSSSVTNGSGTSVTVSNILPGTWKVYLLDSADRKINEKTVVFTSGKTSTVSFEQITDKIIAHVEKSAGWTHVYAWVNESEKIFGEWPGRAMTDTDSDGWYDVEIEKTSCNLIFNGSTPQTKDLSLDAGEWWYKDGKWYSGNPEDSVAPVLESFTSDKTGTVSGTVKLTAVASDNASLKEIVFYAGEKNIGSVEAGGTSANVSFEWDTSLIKNGTYTLKAIAYDAANNPSEEKTITITTSNVNLPPVAVISGSSFAKVDTEKEFSAAASYDQNGGTIKYYSWTVSSGEIKSGAGTEKITVKMPSGECDVTISLKVTDDEGADSETVSKTVTVKQQAVSSGDFREESIYFLMTTRFYDGDPSNNRYCWDDEACFKSETLGDPGWRGDFKGLIEKLDYIKALGFTAIWITPVVENASGLDYHGYHAFDFSRVDPRYESSGATYQDLIDACHSKGIKVIQDIVLNHTGNFGERNLLPIMKKNYSDDDGLHSVPAVPDHDSKDIYGNSAYEKLSKGAKLQGFDKYEDIEASSLTSDKKGGALYQSRLMTMKNDDIDTDEPGRLYHHYGNFEWESYYVQEGQMAGDCVDLNTENPVVAKYLRDCYINYINMGVDGFRIDTMKHISRLTMNKEFIPYFREAGGDGFFMFGEGCVLRNEVWNSGMPGISIPFYTWNQNSLKTDNSYSWETQATGAAANLLMAKTHFDDNTVGVQLTSNNAFLSDNTYHAPDYSKASGLHMIDFYMHHGFENAGAAFSIAKIEDSYFNDATYNVMYVDSHDYGPNSGGYLYTRYSGGTEAWAGNFNLMFTFRGIPCVYYGSEIEFQKNMQIEPYTNGNKVPYSQSGRAYFGDHLEGTVNATDFGEYTASGEVANTLNYDLAQHLIRLNKIRRAIPALQKGQYSTEGCSGSIAFKRRYTDDTVDSFALVTINGGATFSNIPGGKYVEVITGQTADVSEGGSITTDSIDSGNMRIYVLKTANCGVDGKIGTDGVYLK